MNWVVPTTRLAVSMPCSVAQPPSRATNPFATCWTAPGKLPWFASADASLEAIADRLASAPAWGAIVGPHGSGKSSLLVALAPLLERRGHRIVWHVAPSKAPLPHRPATLLIEGFERLGPIAQQLLLLRCWQRRLGVVATLHNTGRGLTRRLPVIAQTAPDPRLLRHLVNHLLRHTPSPRWVSDNDALEAFHKSNGNLRDVWFTLYNLYEARRRGAPTNPHANEKVIPH